MHLLAIFCCLAVLVSAYPENHFKNHVPSSIETAEKLKSSHFEYLTTNGTIKSASLSDFGIYFYTRKNRNHPVVIINNDVLSVLFSGFFNPDARTISITHGWQNDYSSPLNTGLVEAILDTHDVNIFISDWGSIAHSINYITAQAAIPYIGSYLGDFLNLLVSAYGISHKQITLIGHSLGAHIAGMAGAATTEKVDVIIGLDPAGPFIGADSCLSIDHADFVHVIHTNADLLGWRNPIGHADYYPNGGGPSQPGCDMDMAGMCAHGKAYQYLADSIANPKQKYWAYKCEDWSTFDKHECFNNNLSYLGTLEVDKRANGSYYLETNSEAPYAIEFDPFKQ